MSYRKPYIESSVFIEYIREDDSAKTKIVKSILDAADGGQFMIVTATWTIAEVHKRKNFGEKVLEEDESMSLLESFRENYIDPVEVDRHLAESAHALCRKYLPNGKDKSLRPGDAIHIAAAERAGCDVILSYDPDFLKLNYTTIPIKEPEMVQLIPRETTADKHPESMQLFDNIFPEDEKEKG